MKCKVKLTVNFIMELPDDIKDPEFFIEEHLCGASLFKEAIKFFEDYEKINDGCFCAYIDRELVNYHKDQ